MISFSEGQKLNYNLRKCYPLGKRLGHFFRGLQILIHNASGLQILTNGVLARLVPSVTER